MRHLKYFVATAEIGQVSRAAVELSVSQSAVTGAIKELEATVEARLFDRSAQGMTLTDAGRRFLGAARDVLSKVDDALNVADSASVAGRLSVAASYTVIGYFLPAHLERLSRLQPNLDVAVHEMTRETIEEALLSRRIDIGVALTANIVNPEIVCETLLRSPRRLWTPARHRLLGVEAASLGDVAKEPYVMLTVDEAAHTAMRYWGPTALQPRVTLRTSSVEAVRSLVANGGAVSILSDMVYRPWSLEGKRIETITLAEPIPPMDVGLVWRRGVEFTPAMTAFRDYFAERYLHPGAHLA